MLVRKNRLCMNWYIFLGHEYSIFNAIVNHLIALKTLKTNNLWGFTPRNPTRALPQTPSWNYDFFAIALFLIKLNLLPQSNIS